MIGDQKVLLADKQQLKVFCRQLNLQVFKYFISFVSSLLNSYTQIEPCWSHVWNAFKIIDSSDSFHVTTFDRKNHNIHIDVESVKIPININFCQIKNEDIDDIESILKKIEGTLPEVSTKQIYPNNYVWADWSTQ